MNDLNYRQNDKGGWDVYFNNEEFGITFWLPDGYKPEDYNIIFESNDVLNAPLRRCHNVNIEFLNTPEKTTGRLAFDKYSGVHFIDNLMVCIKDGFNLMSLTSLIILTAFLRSRVMKLTKLMSKINGMKTLQYTLTLALKATQATI